MRADQDMRTLAAGQTSAAASARGPAGLALAQQGAAANTANGTSAISNLAQINSAQERSDAEKAAMAGYTGIRGQDAAQQGQDFGQAKSQADIDAAQRAENDKYSLGLYGDSIGINNSQLNAQGNQIGIETGASTAQANRDAATNTANANRNSALGQTIVGGVLTGGATFGAAAVGGSSKSGSGSADGGAPASGAGGVGMDQGENGPPPSGLPTDPENDPNNPKPLADGGPTHAGRPYLVGERGPEIIVPRDNGYVLTAEQTRSLARHTPAYSDYRTKQEIQPIGAEGFYADEAPPRPRMSDADAAKLSARADREFGITPDRPRMSDTEAAKLSALADRQFGGQGDYYAASLGAGPSVGSRDDALMRRADSWLSAQREGNAAQLAGGPSVGGARPRMSDAEAAKLSARADREFGGQRASNEALLSAGPSVGGRREPPAWLREEMEPTDAGDERYAYSDDQTKVVAAQREAFRAGLNHANEARDTGSLPEPPEYMIDQTRRHQPAAEPRKAATPIQRADPNPQRDEVFRREDVRDRGNFGLGAGLMLGPAGFPQYGAAALGLGALTHAEENAREDERARLAPPKAPTADAAVYNAEQGAAPDYLQSIRNTLSDERTKQGLRAESDMGVALAEGFKPYEYEYKPGFAQRERQAPGEKNVGPMAQDMASNSITGSAVKKAPNGLLVVDLPKATKVNSAGIGYLAQKQEEMAPSLASALAGVDKLHARVRELEDERAMRRGDR